MNTVLTDINRNFISIRLESAVNLSEALSVAQQVFFQIEMFKGQGFRVLLDVRDAEPFTPDVAGVWVHIGREARARGMVKCARLVGSQGWREVAQRVAREAGNDDLVMDFTDEATAVHWLTHATSRSLT